GISVNADRLLLREVVVADGSLSYLLTQPNTAWRIDELSASFVDQLGNGESKGTGSFRWRDEKVTFTTQLADARAFARGQASPLNLKADVKHLALELKGELAPVDNGQIRGSLVAKIDSLRDFARWLDFDPGPYALKGPATLEGPVTISQAVLGLQTANLKTDAGESTWDAQLRFTDARPLLSGNIVWHRLDLQKLLGETPKIPALAVEARTVRQGTTIPSAWPALNTQLAALNAAGAISLTAATATPAPPPALRARSRLEARY